MKQGRHLSTAQRFRAARGFTLVELVMVIVITGVIAASLVTFFKPALDSYLDTSRRAGLTDMADTAVRRIARELRIAVPNSLRIANNQCFEFLPSSAGGRFRSAADTVNSGSAALDITQAVTQFDVLSPLATLPAAGDWVVINNQNTDDVYAGTNRAAIVSVTTPDPLLGQYRLRIASTQFPSGYDNARFLVVANNAGNPVVSYVCAGADGSLDAQGDGKGSLYRVTAPFVAAYPTACAATAGAALLASKVASCNFVYDPNHGATQQSGFVWMQISLTQANETVALSFGAHVDNVP